MINGVFCHETGCPNSRKTWVEERGEWVRFVDCRNCGAEVEQGDTCRCDEPEEEEASAYLEETYGDEESEEA